MRILKNIQFTDLIKIDGQLREFNFRKPNGRTESPFSVDTIDTRGQRIIFTMQKHEESWQIVHQEIPQWIKENEEKLSNAIRENLNGFEMYVSTSNQRHNWQRNKWIQLLRFQ